MTKRGRIEYEFDSLTIETNNIKKIDAKYCNELILNKIKRDREEDLLNEMFMEKRHKLETEEYNKNGDLRKIRLKKLHDSMYK